MYRNSNFQKYLTKLFLITGIAFFYLMAFETKAQQSALDTSQSDVSKSKIMSFLRDTIHSPKKAMILSTFIPGAGQIYNRKYWKFPIVYAGFAGLGYSFVFNNNKYLKYKNEYINRVLDPTLKPKQGEYTTEELNVLQESYRRYRDLSVIGAFVLFTFNIIDAGVDAHLLNFNVDENLSLKIQPTIYQSYSRYEPAAAFNLRWKF